MAIEKDTIANNALLAMIEHWKMSLNNNGVAGGGGGGL